MSIAFSVLVVSVGLYTKSTAAAFMAGSIAMLADLFVEQICESIKNLKEE